METAVQELLLSIFRNLLEDHLELGITVGPKFYGFLSDFVAQFGAVSYGDVAFASVLFIFLRMEFPAISNNYTAMLLPLIVRTVTGYSVGGN